jgi:hypothetical protein
MTFGYRLSAASLDVLVNSTSSSPVQRTVEGGLVEVGDER